ncbi:porin [Paraburkholderia antibiotica]|uniref:Porin n=1 Tax=Paraburkholderia antibiotica TaxID=2728839 RepID=A0A7X9ZXA6_9BURK|nr:porin [Paraburkholderia antibiotica]NML31929.1 porin [Paraburkholderia antibiotica]
MAAAYSPELPAQEMPVQFSGWSDKAYTPVGGDSVNFYGRFINSIDWVTGGGNHGSVRMANYGSAWGFRGSETLTSDLKAVFQVESAFSTTDGTGTFGGRETFVGLASKTYGSLRMGRFQAPFDRHGIFGDTLAETQGLGITTILWSNCGLGMKSSAGLTKGQGCFDIKYPTSIRYDSPNFGPVFGAVQYYAYDQDVNNGGLGAPHVWSASLNYVSGRLQAAIGFEGDYGVLGPGQNNYAAEILAGYQLTQSVYFGGIVQQLNYQVNAQRQNIRQNMLGLVARYTPGPWGFELNYGVAGSGYGSAPVGASVGAVKKGPATGAQHIVFTTRYDLSKRTALYGQLVALRNASNAIYSIKPMGVQSPGKNEQGISLGMIHYF